VLIYDEVIPVFVKFQFVPLSLDLKILPACIVPVKISLPLNVIALGEINKLL
jgi:hypothetical protein